MANRKILGLALFIAFCGLASFMFYQGQTRFLVARLQSESNQESWQLFQNYVKMNNKAYNGQEEFFQRYDIFHQNYLLIQNENQKGYSYKLALNQFADLTAQEFKEQYLNLIPRNHDIRMKSNDQMDNLPDSVDWVEKGAVNPVRDQGRCGSCWAFATIAGIESAYYLKNGKLLDFSEQQLVDCSRKYGNKGCAGGLLEESYEYFMDFQFEKESDYPYEGNDNSCWYQEKLGQGYLSNYVNVKKNELALKASVSQRPTPILVDASTWQFYNEGILSNCHINLDHAVLAVGYGIDNGQMFWKIKNSWGVGWGEQGFIRILRTESETSQGQCGVAVDPVYPVL